MISRRRKELMIVRVRQFCSGVEMAESGGNSKVEIFADGT